MKILSLTKLLFWSLTIVCSFKVGDKFSVSFILDNPPLLIFFYNSLGMFLLAFVGLKVCGACYTVRTICDINNMDSLKTVYFAHYEIIFVVNNNKNIFILKRKTVRIMAGTKLRNSCTPV